MRVWCGVFVLLFSFGCLSSAAEKDWWESTVFYQIYPRSFQDSNNDGIGDLKGIMQRLEHLKETGITATWLSPIFKSPMADFGYDISDYRDIQAEYGTMEDFDLLIQKATELGIKIILDFVPNHTSDQHEWFLRSEAGDPEYADFYIWHKGTMDGDERKPPNNWISVFRGPAWTYSEKRQSWYFHQFTRQQPDLNFRNPAVVEEMKNVLRFWLEKGVAGFRCDAVNHMFEVEDLRDEPESGFDPDPQSYGHLNHWYTKDLPEVYEQIYSWRNLLDDWQATHGGPTRIMMTEAYANISFTMRYYQSEDGRKGSHIPFNFLLISDLNRASTANDFVHTINKWLSYMPAGATANWVLGNHDNSRVGSRYGAERIDALNAMLLTLPGAGVSYNGEEIGMVDFTSISWEDTKDPAACNSDEKHYKEFSRDPERTPFQWNDSENAGFSTSDKTWLPMNPNYVDINLQAQKLAQRSHYKFYARVMQLRSLDTFKYGDIKIQALNQNVFAFVREHRDADSYVVVINLGESYENVNLMIFSTLRDKLKVVAASPASEYAEGNIVESSSMSLGEFDAVILINNVGNNSSSSSSSAVGRQLSFICALLCTLVTFLMSSSR